MENILDVAIYIYRNLVFSTDKQVQKITYYAYCWYIVKNNINNSVINRLFEQHPEAWVHGPVFYDLFEEMTYNRNNFINRRENLKVETKEFLNKIISIYGKYTGNQLEDLTHKEQPWIEARGDLSSCTRSRVQIKDSTIYDYYSV